MFAKQMYRNTGIAMSIWCEEKDNYRVQELFDMSLIRDAGLSAMPPRPTVTSL